MCGSLLCDCHSREFVRVLVEQMLSKLPIGHTALLNMWLTRVGGNVQDSGPHRRDLGTENPGADPAHLQRTNSPTLPSQGSRLKNCNFTNLYPTWTQIRVTVAGYLPSQMHRSASGLISYHLLILILNLFPHPLPPSKIRYT